MTVSTIIDNTGEIRKVINTPDAEHLAANTPAGCSAVDGEPPNSNCYRANDAWIDKPAQPTEFSTWNAATKAWEDVRTIDQVRVDVLAALDAAYGTAIATLPNVTFTTAAGDTHAYQADADSITKLSDSIQGNQATQTVPSGFYWVAADNTQVPFTWADLLGLAAAFYSPGHAAFQQLQTLKDSARSATTIAAVEAVVWPTAA